MNTAHQPPGAYPNPMIPPSKPTSSLKIVVLVLALGALPIVGIMAILATIGVRQYIANAKTAEARNALGQMAKDAASAYEASTVDGKPGRICPSERHPVPASMTSVRGVKYQSKPAEWQAGQADQSGFSCLHFMMNDPQYYRYTYEATATGFVVRAQGDLNGDGELSSFEFGGNLVDGHIVLDSMIAENNPNE
jgi:type IV pilus assembly protein PilA